MVLRLPYVTDQFTAYPGDVASTHLSLAVQLTDDYTKKEPMGNIQVKIKEGNINAFKNLSGYYLFTDLAAGNYNLAVESDFYFPEEKAVTIPHPDPKNPVVLIVIKPRPLYPFPNSATVVRGLVSNANPVVDAEVSVIGKTLKTKTDERGEFALYFRGIKKEDMAIEIKLNGNTKTVNTTIEGREDDPLRNHSLSLTGSEARSRSPNFS